MTEYCMWNMCREEPTNLFCRVVLHTDKVFMGDVYLCRDHFIKAKYSGRMDIARSYILAAKMRDEEIPPELAPPEVVYERPPVAPHPYPVKPPVKDEPLEPEPGSKEAKRREKKKQQAKKNAPASYAGPSATHISGRKITPKQVPWMDDMVDY